MSRLDEAVSRLLDHARRDRISDTINGAAGDVANAIAGQPPHQLDRAIERLLAALDAPHAQAGGIAAFLCGTAVEAGGSPEPVARAVLAKLPGLLHAAVAAQSELEKLDELDLDADGGTPVGARLLPSDSVQRIVDEYPDAARAFFAIDLFCRPLIAALTRAPPLLRSAEAEAVITTLSAFEETSEYAYFLARLLRVPIDETWLVVDPTIERAFEVGVSGVANAFQVYCLLHDALGREASVWQRLFGRGSGLLPTGRPPGELVAVASGAGPQQTDHTYTPPFTLFRWSAIVPGAVPSTGSVHDWYSNSAVPAELSMFEGRRIAVLGHFGIRMLLPVAREFEALRANVTILRELDGPSVAALLRRLADAPRPPPPVPGVG